MAATDSQITLFNQACLQVGQSLPLDIILVEFLRSLFLTLFVPLVIDERDPRAESILQQRDVTSAMPLYLQPAQLLLFLDDRVPVIIHFPIPLCLIMTEADYAQSSLQL